MGGHFVARALLRARPTSTAQHARSICSLLACPPFSSLAFTRSCLALFVCGFDFVHAPTERCVVRTLFFVTATAPGIVAEIAKIELASVDVFVISMPRQVPSAWEKLAYPSMRSLPLWLSNLQVNEADPTVFLSLSFAATRPRGEVYEFLKRLSFLCGENMSQRIISLEQNLKQRQQRKEPSHAFNY